MAMAQPACWPGLASPTKVAPAPPAGPQAQSSASTTTAAQTPATAAF